MVDDKAPAAVILTAIWDLFWTYAPNFAASPDTASDRLTALIVGTTVAGTVSVKLADTAEPIFVLPEYVVTVTFAVPDVALGMAFSQDCGMVYDADVPMPVCVLL